MLLIQKFLRAGFTYSQLLTQYAIKHTRHKKYPNLVLFKYNQIESPFGEGIVRECRGLILDEANDWEIVCHPFDKFFNYGEGNAAQIDWASAYIAEKFDGSLATIYWYDNKWNISTSGTPDASGNVNDFGFNFEDLFWDTWKDLRMPIPTEEYKHMNYMFELMTQYNRVVVRHDKPRIVLLGVRNLATGLEEPAGDHARYGWEYALRKPLGTMEEMLASFDKIDPIHQEGYVVVDRHFNRIKVKHPGYVAIHQLRDNLSQKRMLELVRQNEQGEVLTYFPEWTEQFKELEIKLKELKNDSMHVYSKIYHIESQKEFAVEAVKARVPDALFRMRQGRIASWNQYFAEMKINHLMTSLGLKEEPESSNVQ